MPEGTEATCAIDGPLVADAYGRILAVVWCQGETEPPNGLFVMRGNMR